MLSHLVTAGLWVAVHAKVKAMDAGAWLPGVKPSSVAYQLANLEICLFLCVSFFFSQVDIITVVISYEHCKDYKTYCMMQFQSC